MKPPGSRLAALLVAFAACVAPPAADPPSPPADTAPAADTDWICAPDDAVCDGTCRAVRFDEGACGDCGVACEAGEVCDEGVCRAPPVAPPCDADALAALRAPTTAEAPTVALACSATLDPGDVITRKVQLLGAEASGVTLDCNGATLRAGRPEGGPDTLQISARRLPDGGWSRPTDVTVRGCRVEGSVRVWGLGLNGQDGDVPADSWTEGHRERAQLAAPTRVRLDALEIVGAGRIPLYLSPGATEVTVTGCTLTGRSVSTAVYLDAESARNTLAGNTFAVRLEGSPLAREVLALDGTADNLIVGNVFEDVTSGGVFVYRNCGEGGAVRHQEPRRNVLTGNTFAAAGRPWQPTLWVGSRNGPSFYRVYCPLDDGYPFGSSVRDDDFARNTVLVGNRFAPETAEAPVRLDDAPTLDADNLPGTAPPAPACVRFRHHAAPRVRVGDACGP